MSRARRLAGLLRSFALYRAILRGDLVVELGAHADNRAGALAALGCRVVVREPQPAFAAIRCNPDLRAKYRQLTGQGKPPKVALTAVMRKLLMLANALLGQDRCWLPDRPGRDNAAPAGSTPLVAA